MDFQLKDTPNTRRSRNQRNIFNLKSDKFDLLWLVVASVVTTNSKVKNYFRLTLSYLDWLH